MLSVVVCLTLLSMLLAASVATAATVEISPDGVLTYAADPGDVDAVWVLGSSLNVKVASTSSPSLTAGPGCAAADPYQGYPTVECPRALISSYAIDLGDQDDQASVWMDAPGLISGGSGDDQFEGGGTTLTGETVGLTIQGGAGDDNYEDLSSGDDTYHGGPGIDTADYSAKSAPVSLTLDGERNDGVAGEADLLDDDVESLTGSEYVGNTLIGNDGPNAIRSRGGGDHVEGRGGNDYLTTWWVFDSDRREPSRLYGGDGDDLLISDAGADEMYGGAGDDMFGPSGWSEDSGGTGDDVFDGGTGVDTVIFGTSAGVFVSLDDEANDGIAGENANVLSTVENVIGTAYDDVLIGSDSDNYLSGMGGDDTLDGGDGADLLDGDGGDDTVDYSGRSEALRITPYDGQHNDGAAGEGDEVNADTILTGSGDDVVDLSAIPFVRMGYHDIGPMLRGERTARWWEADPKWALDPNYGSTSRAFGQMLRGNLGDGDDTAINRTARWWEADPNDGSTTFDCGPGDDNAADTTPADTLIDCEDGDEEADTTPPETSISSGPDALTSSALAHFFFGSDDPDATLECRLDGGDWESCSSPADYADLTDGEHVFRTRATDAAGNTDPTPATWSWTVDTTPPETSISSGPDELTDSPDATLELSSNDPNATLECRLDGGEWESCSSPVSYSDLADGAHEFHARATDKAGNTDPSPAIWSWTVETVTEPTDPPTDPVSVVEVRPDDPRPGDIITVTVDIDVGQPCDEGAGPSVRVGADPAEILGIDWADPVADNLVAIRARVPLSAESGAQGVTVGCGDTTWGPAYPVTVQNQPNQPPVANIVAARAHHSATLYRLDGRASMDPDGERLRYIWRVPRASGHGWRMIGDRSRAKRRALRAGRPGAGRLNRVRLTVVDPQGARDTATVRLRPGRDTISRVVLYGFDQSSLGARARRVLRHLRPYLPETRKLQLRGHTDSRGSRRYNQRLGLRRARAARDYLLRHVSRADRPRTHVRSFGERQPIARNRRHGRDYPAGRRLNRRVEIVLHMR